MLQLLKHLDRKAEELVNNIDNELGEPTVRVLTLKVFSNGETPAATPAGRQAAPETAPQRQKASQPQPAECIEGCYPERALA